MIPCSAYGPCDGPGGPQPEVVRPIFAADYQTTVGAGATVELADVTIGQGRTGEIFTFWNDCDDDAAWADLFWSVVVGNVPISQWWGNFQGQRGLPGITFMNLYARWRGGQRAFVEVRNAGAVDRVATAALIGRTW